MAHWTARHSSLETAHWTARHSSLETAHWTGRHSTLTTAHWTARHWVYETAQTLVVETVPWSCVHKHYMFLDRPCRLRVSVHRVWSVRSVAGTTKDNPDGSVVPRRLETAVGGFQSTNRCICGMFLRTNDRHCWCHWWGHRGLIAILVERPTRHSVGIGRVREYRMWRSCGHRKCHWVFQRVYWTAVWMGQYSY